MISSQVTANPSPPVGPALGQRGVKYYGICVKLLMKKQKIKWALKFQ